MPTLVVESSHQLMDVVTALAGAHLAKDFAQNIYVGHATDKDQSVTIEVNLSAKSQVENILKQAGIGCSVYPNGQTLQSLFMRPEFKDLTWSKGDQRLRDLFKPFIGQLFDNPDELERTLRSASMSEEHWTPLRHMPIEGILKEGYLYDWIEFPSPDGTACQIAEDAGQWIKPNHQPDQRAKDRASHIEDQLYRKGDPMT